MTKKTDTRLKLKWILGAAAILALLCFFPNSWAQVTNNPAQAPANTRPNIVFILTDDLSLNLLQFMPNVQDMERDGTSFSNYFVTDSLCCPSRTSILTGKFPHNSGVFTNSGNDGGYAAFNAHGNEPQTFAVTLQKAGYVTAMYGKYLNGYSPEWRAVIGDIVKFFTGHRPTNHPIPQGWGEWGVGGNRAYQEFNYALNINDVVWQFGNQPKDYLTDVMGRLSAALIRTNQKKPFFIELATFAPHAPYVPAPEDGHKFPNLAYDNSPPYGARPDAAAPSWLKAISPLGKDDVDRVNQVFRRRAQSVLAVDRMVGAIRAQLATLGLDKNTYVVFSSDNGYHLGEYSLREGKRTPFDVDVHVPLIVVGPNVRAGAVIDNLVENVDLCPTFAEIAGRAPPTSADGHSLFSLISGNAPLTRTPWRAGVLVEHHHAPYDSGDPDKQQPLSGDPPDYEALRMANSLYVEYDNPAHEVGYYDLRNDPNELHNVASQLDAGARKNLHDLLHRYARCKGANNCWITN